MSSSSRPPSMYRSPTAFRGCRRQTEEAARRMPARSCLTRCSGFLARSCFRSPDDTQGNQGRRPTRSKRRAEPRIFFPVGHYGESGHVGDGDHPEDVCCHAPNSTPEQTVGGDQPKDSVQQHTYCDTHLSRRSALAPPSHAVVNAYATGEEQQGEREDPRNFPTHQRSQRTESEDGFNPCFRGINRRRTCV